MGAPFGANQMGNAKAVVHSECLPSFDPSPIGPDARTLLGDRPIGGVAKRIVDVICAGGAFVLLLPLWLMVAAAVRATSPGPVFYGHVRIGHSGRPFHCWKFRTMVVDGDAVLERHFLNQPGAREEWERDRKLRSDPRVTRLGEVLRKTSVDELPQLLNVILGEMSLVGPRPVVAEELERYGHDAPFYLAARPGITGLWQISGRSDTTYGERVLLDRRYVSEWSLALDLSILAKTVPAVLAARGSC